MLAVPTTSSNDTMSGSDYVGEGVASANYGHPVANTIYQIVLPVICACGILGIILTVIVLSRKNMTTSTNCYLMALAVADLLFLVLLATILMNQVGLPHSQAAYYFQIYVAYAVILMNICLIASSWLTVMLAIERYVAICQPFLAARFCSVTKARVFIVTIFVFAVLCRLANFWENRITSSYDTSTNRTVVYHEATELSYDSVYTTVYPWVVDGVLASIVPFLLLLILNVRLIWEVRKSTQYIQRNLMVAGSANSAVQREELQITIMLISVIIVFFLCQAPYVIYTATTSINKFAIMGSNIMLFRAVTTLLLVLKSAVNFILYCWFSEKFWATLKKIFCMDQCLLMHKSHNSQNSNYLHLRRFSSCATRESTFCIGSETNVNS